MTARTSHRRSSGALRRLPSGRWQARYTGPDGAMRTIGTFAAKIEADQALAQEVSTMARGGWRDPRLGEQPLGEWFRNWIATRTDIVGIRTLASLTPAVVREWNHAETTESTRRVTERWERSSKHDTRVNAAIRAWAAASGAPLAPTGRIPVWARDGWVAATGGVSVPERPLRRNAGQTAATQAYRLLHAGMAQAVADELIAANPCAAPKTRAGKRAVVLPKIAVAALREHMTRFTPPGRESLIFGTQNGTPLSSGSRSTMFAKARGAIGREDLTWHDQRHSALTLVAATGATLPELMERAGHASPRAALHYQHAVDDSQRRIAARLDEVLTERPRTA